MQIIESQEIKILQKIAVAAAKIIELLNSRRYLIEGKYAIKTYEGIKIEEEVTSNQCAVLQNN